MDKNPANLLGINGGGSLSSNITKSTQFNIVVKADVEIVPWSTGTDEQILAMVQAMDSGRLSAEDTGWQVGDTRTISLSAFQKYGTKGSTTTSTQASQSAQLVIMHKGSKQFSSGGECHFIVGFIDNLCSSYICANNFIYGSSWLKTVDDNIYNALPDTIKQIFKPWKAVYAYYAGNNILVDYSDVYFASPAEGEIFTSRVYSIEEEFNLCTQLDWYKTDSHRNHTKFPYTRNSIKYYIWAERSLFENVNNIGLNIYMCEVREGNASADGDSGADGIPRAVSPFGCI